MREKKFILIDTGSESNRINMGDVGLMDNGIQISDTHKHVNRIVDFLIHAHFSYAIACHIDLPYKAVWSKYCVLDELTKDNAYEYYVVVVNNAIHRLSVKYLNDLTKRENVHIFSLLLDSFDKLPENIRKMIKQTDFEKVFSFQKSDCEKYNFIYTNQIYSKANMDIISSDGKSSDVYFIGAEKGRMRSIADAYQKLSQNGLHCDFTVIVKRGELKQFSAKYPGIHFLGQRVGYKEILKHIKTTKCILELCQEGQDGLTMRFYEALFYNKLLITNNRTALMHPCYEDKYMQVISCIDDIDTSYFGQNEPIDYHYDNTLSPRFFMEKLPEYTVKGNR